MDQISYKIVGLDCAEEVAILKKVLAKAPGIQDLAFNVLQAKMIVTYDPKEITSQEIMTLVASTGMKAIYWDEADLSHRPIHFWNKHGRLILTALSGLFILAGAVISKYFYFAAILCGVWYVLPKAYFSVRNIRPDMNLLMVIAIIGAIGIEELFEGATVAFLYAVALLLEQWSVGRAQRAISSLLELSPHVACVITDSGHIEERRVEEVEVGSLILVRPGEKIPLDGVVAKGNSSINQAPITGESIPVFKEPGDEVFAGTLNEEGALECWVTKEAGETTLARIIHLVEEARAKRSAREQWVEHFAKFYTPLMLLFSLLVMIVPPLFFALSWNDWIYRGLVLLVIACPCALVISTPVSIVSALTAAARHGVLIKGGVHLETAGTLKVIALDKTGTLTYGHPEVQQIVPMNDYTEKDLLEIAAALEQQSEHPLARAILRKAQERGILPKRAESFQVVKGKGAEGKYDGEIFWIGSHRFMHERGQETEEIHQKALELEDAGHSVIALGNKDHVCGLISVADAPRQFIRETIEAIKAMGIQKIVMLTGDNEPTARALAQHAGVDEFYAELLPEDKVNAVIALKKQWHKVAMIGDGINDAPALATATLGIAMGGMGTDVAIENSDIALMSDDLSKVPWLIRHSRKTLQIIKQNIVFSLGIKSVFIVLALFHLATLWMAIAADTGATLVVVFNGMRLLKR